MHKHPAFMEIHELSNFIENRVQKALSQTLHKDPCALTQVREVWISFTSIEIKPVTCTRVQRCHTNMHSFLHHGLC